MFPRKHFVVVSEKAVRRARISDGQLAAGIHVAEKNLRNGLSTLVAWVVGHDDGFRGIRNPADDARAPFRKHQNYRLSRFHDLQREVELRIR